MLMKYLLLLFCIFYYFSDLMAQHKIGYAYDAAGNRVRREIVMNNPRFASMSTLEPSDIQTFTERLGECTIELLSNPSEGVLRLRINEWREDYRCSVGVYSLHGKQISSSLMDSDSMVLDLSSQPAGTYLIKIILNDQTTTWKIIKK